MEQPFPPVRRHILLALLASILIFLSLVFVISPLVIDSASQTTRQSRLIYLWFTPPLMAILIGLAYRYLAPASRLRDILRQGEEPPPEVVRPARRVAFDAPAFLFVLLVGLTVLVTFLANIVGLFLTTGYELAPYFSESLLTIAVAISTGLLLALVARWRLRPVLATTAQLGLQTSRPPTGEGHRFTVRTRLLVVMLVLTVVAFYLPSILALNLVHRAVQEAAFQRHQQWIEITIQETAPRLDDEALIRHVEEVSLPDEGQAFIVDSQRSYITRRPTPPPSLPDSGGQAIEGQILQPLNRPEHDWYLGVVYDFRAESHPLVHRALLVLLGFGLAILALTLPIAFAVTGDITDDLRQITRRLMDIAWMGRVGEQLHVLSLDEIGDLVRAFNEVQVRVQTQQETLQQEHWRLLALQAISSRISAIFNLDQLLDELVKSVKTIFGYHNTLILLVDEAGEQLYLAASGYHVAPQVEERRFRIESEKDIGHAISTGEALLIPDVNQRDFHIVSSPDVRSTIVAPMFVGGRLIGIFEVESTKTNAFKKQDLQLATSLANQAAAAIEAARLLQESRTHAQALGQWARNLMLINRIVTSLASSLDADEILNMAVQRLVELIGVNYGSALILERDRLHGLIVAEHPSGQLTNSRLQLPDLPSAQRALELGTPYVVEDAEYHPLLAFLQQQYPSIDFRSLLVVPLVARDEMIGLLILASLDQPRTFSNEEIDICQTVASQAAVAVANARLLQDIQQQQRALRVKSQELTTESGKLDAIINNVADGLVVTDTIGCIILSNPVFRQMADLPPTRPLRDRLLPESFPVADLQDLVAQTLQTPDKSFTENLEMPDGRVLKASTTALRLPPLIQEPGSEEQVAGVVTVLRDITHEVEVDRVKTDFISAVAHELRTPLTSIMGFASLILRDLQRHIIPRVNGSEESHQVIKRVQDNLNIIEGESKRITRLINDMLDIAKMEAGRMEWHMEETSLDEVIAQAVAATTALAAEKSLPIQVHLPPAGLPIVWGDRDQLVQVMTNLLSNAIKFTEEGEVEVRGWMLEGKDKTLHRSGPSTPLHSPASTAQETLASFHFLEGEWVVVSVTDTGMGIHPDDVPHLFEKYRRVGDTLTQLIKGTGLGLSICREIVEHHGGHIWVESEQGNGSTFSFALPVRPFPIESQEGTDPLYEQRDR
jgi:signal transduction histidine kinase